MKAGEILKAAQGRLLNGSSGTPIRGFSIDSRTLKKGELFIAIKGNRFDGHDFLRDAFNKGAAGIAISRDASFAPRPSSFVIKVKDTTKALGDIARYKRMRSRATVIAVTGSTGKTTTKDMISSILKKRGSVLSTKGTENNHIGVPLTLLRLRDERFCVLELGMNHFGEIGYLANIALPDMGIITNIGPCHLQGIGDIEGVFRAKTELLRHMDKGNYLILNGDDTYLSRINSKSLHILTFGTREGNDTTAEAVTLGQGCCRFKVNGKYEVRLNLLGEHNVYNALAAITAAGLLKVSRQTIRNALAEFKPPSGRLEVKKAAGVRIIDDSYNSNPLSLKSALLALKNYKTDGRKILVNGDMLELGGMSAYFHESIADIIEESGVDMLITVGRRSRSTYRAAKARGFAKGSLHHFAKPRDAGHFLKKITGKGDVILIKGSRSIMMEEAVRCFTTSFTR